MASLAPSPTAPLSLPAARRRSWDRAAMAVALLAFALFLFAGPAMPILLWDESRNIVNAMEMANGGWSLVTTFHGAPDLWNTKPPLMIWLMVASTKLFGPTLWALRLPSIIATLATLLVMMVFVRRVTRSTGTAILSALLFAASPALYSEHGARSADYDALLVFFTTSYAAMLFLALHASPRRWALPAALAIAGAVLTKNVAGLLPGIGIALYWTGIGGLPRLWRTRQYAIAAACAATLILIFYLLREAAAPGYLAASWHNDGPHRFGESIIGAEKPAGFYVSALVAGYFGATPILLLAPIALMVARGRSRLLMLYSSAIAAALIALLSASGSKLSHYILPALPFLAILAAVTVRTLLRRAIRSWRRGDSGIVTAAVPIFLAILLGGTAQRAIAYRYDNPVQDDFAARQAHYGALIDRLAPMGRPITIVEPGFRLEADLHYTGVLDAYRLIAGANGIATGHVLRIADVPAKGIVASCDPATIATLARRGPDIASLPGCFAGR